MNGMCKLLYVAILLLLFFLASPSFVQAQIIQYNACAGTLPINQGWVVAQGVSPPAPTSCDLIIGPTSTAEYIYWEKNQPGLDLLNFDNELLLYLKMRVISSSYADDGGGGGPRWGFYVSMTDTQNRFTQLAIASDRVSIVTNAFEPAGVGDTSMLLDTTVEREYSLNISSGVITLYVDGALAISRPLGPAVGTGTTIWFGDGSSGADCHVEVERLVLMEAEGDLFIRGDCNIDGGLDIGDAIRILSFLFSSGAPHLCYAACDTNDDGVNDIGDAVYFLAALFSGGSAPPAPNPTCGFDLTPDALDCQQFSSCP